MTVPAYALPAHVDARREHTGSPDTRGIWSLPRVLADAARNEAISDANYRFYAVVISRFGTERFTATQAGEVASMSVGSAGKRLGALVSAGVLTSSRRTRYNDAGRKVTYRIYRAAGVS